MCYLAAYPPGVMPDEEYLQNGVRLNPHGFGWSVGSDEVYHTMNPVAAIDTFLDAREDHPQENAIFHARYSTGSPHTLANCQPLVLDDGTIVAHNGALFPVFGPRSDTRVFAEQHLPYWDLNYEPDRRELCGLLGHNKLVVLRPGSPLLVLNDRHGIWQADGSWHSNADYTGKSHLAAGACGACRCTVPGLPAASLCDECGAAYAGRRDKLEEAR